MEPVLATDEEKAVQASEALGFPVVVKLHSKTITHKTEVGGVKLGLSTPAAVRDAYRDIESSVRAKVGPEHFLRCHRRADGGEPPRP